MTNSLWFWSLYLCNKIFFHPASKFNLVRNKKRGFSSSQKIAQMSLIELPQLIFQHLQRKLTMADMLLGYCNNYPQKVYFFAFELLFSVNCMHGQ